MTYEKTYIENNTMSIVLVVVLVNQFAESNERRKSLMHITHSATNPP